MPKNIILSSINHSLVLIKKHKKIILALLFLQIIFLGLMLGLQMYYQMKALDVAQEITEYLGEQDLSDINVAKNIAMGTSLLGDDPLMIYRNYREIAGFMLRLGLYSLIGYLVFGSLLWALTDQLIHKKNKKKFLSYVGKFCLLAVGFFALISLFMYLGFKGVLGSYISASSLHPLHFIYFILALMFVYFLFISFALISKARFKDIMRETSRLGTKKAHTILLMYLINLLIIGLLVRFVHLLSDKNILFLSTALLLLLFGFVWIRLFLVLVVDKLKV